MIVKGRQAASESPEQAINVENDAQADQREDSGSKGSRKPPPKGALFTETDPHSPARLERNFQCSCWLCFWKQINVEWSHCKNNN